jgi:hypothetical protein
VVVHHLPVEPADHARLSTGYFRSLRTTMKYVIASANASAASAGFGISAQATESSDHALDLDLAGRAVPVTANLTSWALNWRTGRSMAAASATATPLAWATGIAVLAFRW